MPITNFSNISGIGGFLAEANNQTSGWFWAGINFMIFAVIFITLSVGAGVEAGLITACFIAILLSVFLTYLGLQAWWIAGVYVGLLIILVIYLMWSNKYD